MGKIQEGSHLRMILLIVLEELYSKQLTMNIRKTGRKVNHYFWKNMETLPNIINRNK